MIRVALVKHHVWEFGPRKNLAKNVSGPCSLCNCIRFMRAEREQVGTTVSTALVIFSYSNLALFSMHNFTLFTLARTLLGLLDLQKFSHPMSLSFSAQFMFLLGWVRFSRPAEYLMWIGASLVFAVELACVQ